MTKVSFNPSGIFKKIYSSIKEAFLSAYFVSVTVVDTKIPLVNKLTRFLHSWNLHSN